MHAFMRVGRCACACCSEAAAAAARSKALAAGASTAEAEAAAVVATEDFDIEDGERSPGTKPVGAWTTANLDWNTKHFR